MKNETQTKQAEESVRDTELQARFVNFELEDVLKLEFKIEVEQNWNFEWNSSRTSVKSVRDTESQALLRFFIGKLSQHSS